MNNTKNNDIDIIFNNANTETILRLILEQMEKWQIKKIRTSIRPHWADNMYDKWKFDDPLLTLVFSKEFIKTINIRDCRGESNYESVKHRTCLLCNKQIISDKSISYSCFSHVFNSCIESKKLMKKAEDEVMYRLLMEKKINERKKIKSN